MLAKRAADIRRMFGRIADRYDLLNRLLSVGRDVAWRRRLARRVAGTANGPVLDVCTGTGDVALALPSTRPVLASDFCLPMLARAAAKGRRRQRPLALFAADASRLPLAAGSVTAVTVAFGVRNFERLEGGLGELVRVLVPGGRLLILEFSRPLGPLAPLLGWWSRRVPPLVGRLISGDSDAYAYLPASVAAFPDGEAMCGILQRLGLDPVTAIRLTGGVATLYEGVKAVPPGRIE